MLRRVFAFMLALPALGILALIGARLSSERHFDVSVPACEPQPADRVKLLNAMTHFLARRRLPPFAYVNGSLVQLPKSKWASAEEALAAQPDCCSIAYDDRETWKAPGLRSELGEDFGGFAYVAMKYLFDAEGGTQIVTAFESYVLDSCGIPVITMSDD